MDLRDFISEVSIGIGFPHSKDLIGISIQSKIQTNKKYGGWYGIGEATVDKKHYKIHIRIPNNVIKIAEKQYGSLEESEYDLSITNPSINAYGNLAIVATQITPSGSSRHDLFYDRLENFSKKSGLLKRKKKSLPKTIGSILCITSVGSNIKDDIISNTGIPEGKIRVYNVGSSEKIAMMINNNKYADIVVLYRGGHEDVAMNMFSEEPVLMAIHKSKKPVCVALGHDNDKPFVYNIADQTFSTPSSFGKSIADHNNGVIYDANLRKAKNTKYKLIFIIILMLLWYSFG